jgi:tetratricopeptide (TPR) repeat protein
MCRDTVTFLIVALFVPFAPARGAFQSAHERADSLFEAEKWPEAAEAYEAALKEKPGDGLAWFRLGVSRQQLQGQAEALEAFERARQSGYAPAQLFVRMAVAHTSLGQTEAALDRLEEAFEAELRPEWIEDLPGLAKLREDPRYARLAARYQDPCAQPEHRALDFWLGEWEVRNPQGQVVGANRIEKVLGGCVLLESWKGGLGGEGKSWNYYEARSGKWKQVWVSDRGGVHEYVGEVREGEMHVQAEIPSARGEPRLSRMTIKRQDAGRVRQLIEHSVNGGKSWYAWFEGIYFRKN